jgi:hypothetical protein
MTTWTDGPDDQWKREEEEGEWENQGWRMRRLADERRERWGRTERTRRRRDVWNRKQCRKSSTCVYIVLRLYVIRIVRVCPYGAKFVYGYACVSVTEKIVWLLSQMNETRRAWSTTKEKKKHASGRHRLYREETVERFYCSCLGSIQRRCFTI